MCGSVCDWEGENNAKKDIKEKLRGDEEGEWNNGERVGEGRKGGKGENEDVNKGRDEYARID